MKFLHCADLHIGKRLNQFNLLADQGYILRQIIEIGAEEAVDAVLIAGDVYDKTQPSAEAVAVLDESLTELAALELNIFVIAGNHDSPGLSFGSRLLEKTGFISKGPLTAV